MRDVGVEPVGVSPAPPDFEKIAGAYGNGLCARRDTGRAFGSRCAGWREPLRR